MITNKTIVFCDFDGTITTKDSFIEFIKYYSGSLNFYSGFCFLSPLLILYKLGLYSNTNAKQLVLTYFFKGLSIFEFEKKASEFSLNKIGIILIPKAIEKLNWHKSQQHKVVIVSASINLYLQAWCNKNDFELVATKLATKNNLVTGKIEGKNCYGNEKVNRIKETYNLKEFSEIYAYGDTKGDLPMLNIATKPFYRAFN